MAPASRITSHLTLRSPGASLERPLAAEAQIGTHLLIDNPRRVAVEIGLLKLALLIKDVVEFDTHLDTLRRVVLVDNAQRMEGLLQSIVVLAGTGKEYAITEGIVVQVGTMLAVR